MAPRVLFLIGVHTSSLSTMATTAKGICLFTPKKHLHRKVILWSNSEPLGALLYRGLLFKSAVAQSERRQD